MRPEFNDPPTPFTLSENPPDTVYSRNRDEWDSRIGTQTIQKYRWQQIAFCLLVLCLLLVGFAIYKETKSIIAPYFVLVDAETRAPLEIKKIDGEMMEVGEKEIQYFLSDIVRKTRLIPKDPIVYENNWTAVYAFLTAESSQKMNAVIAEEKQAEYLKNGNTSQIQINSVSRISSMTYQVRWTEYTYEKGGKPLETYRMIGTFEIKLKTPQDEKTLLVNPLGIYIVNFSWSKEM